MSKGYDSFESGIKDYMEKYSYNKEDAKTALTKALTDDMTTFNENLKKSINEKNIAKSQAKKTLLTPYYNQYNAHKNETESKKRQEKKEKILKEMTDETIEEDEKVKQERDEKSENDSPAQSPRSENH